MRTFTTVWWHWYNLCRKEFTTGTKAFLTLLVLSSFLVTTTTEAQTCNGEYFDVDFTHNYDANTDKTTYTWTITDNGAPNAISHWGFDLNTCPPYTVQQFLNGAVAQVLVGDTWQTANTAYGEDKSQDCTSGEVFKFDMSVPGGGSKTFRLIVNGPWNEGIPLVYFKYGNYCCTQAIPGTQSCLEERCYPPDVENQSLSLCESDFGSGTATFNLSALINAITGGRTNVTVTWYSDAGLSSVIANPAAYSPGSKTVYAKVSLNRNPTCYSVAQVVLVVKPRPQCGITGNNNVCPGSSNAYNAPAGMDSYSWSISGNGTITSATNGASVTVKAGTGCGEYTLTVTISDDGCTNTCSKTFSASDTQAPVITATGTTLALGCNPTDAQINAALGAATATDNCGVGNPTFSDGPVGTTGCQRSQTRTWNVSDACGNAAAPVTRTVTWTEDTQAPVITATGTTLNLGCNPTDAQIEAALGSATATDNCGSVTPTPATSTVSVNGCVRTQTRTWNVSDACNNAAVAVTRIVTWTVDVTPPVMSATPASIQAACVTLFADLPWQAPTWTDACGAVTLVSVVTTPNAQQNSCPAVYTRTWTVRDACNNQASFTQTITVPCCTYCTYTQGAYGSAGGKACIGETGPNNLLSTQQLIQTALSATRYGGTMTIGSGARTVNISTGEWQKIIDYLPGGGSSYAFKHNGPITISSDVFKNNYTKKKGNSSSIDNTLLAQTITLGLNIGISPNLYNLQLLPGMYLNTLEATSCGSITPIACTYNSYLPNQTLVGALSTKTVGGLFELANLALGGGQLPSGVNLSMIAEAVDAINNLFDECKIFAGYSSSPISCSSITTSNETRNENITERLSAGKLQVLASPNPYNDKVRFTIESPVSGQSSLEVYNLIGQKVETVFQGYLIEGRGQTIEYKVSPANRTTLIYVLRVGDQQVTGKLLNIK
jgi:hypothetical protein